MYKQNLHTHTTYCDGKNTAREMVESAMALGFDSIGFSGHSCTAFAMDYCMTPQGTRDYLREISALKQEYAGRIDIFCGIEFDIFGQADLAAFDYAIGSVHYLKIGSQFVDFDRDSQTVAQIIAQHFRGDGMAYAQKYYETLAQLPQQGKIDILGHFDLITKHVETSSFFDAGSADYLELAAQAARQLAGKIPYFEVNTGAIARGYRTTPYPAIPIVKELKRLGFEAVITSDCHDAKKLDCEFVRARELLKACGFRYSHVLTREGFRAIRLDG